VRALWTMPGTVTGHSEDRTNNAKAYLVAVKMSFWDGATTRHLVEGLAMAPANCAGPRRGGGNKRRNAPVVCTTISKNAECAF
jgi:hypothetical protein